MMLLYIFFTEIYVTWLESARVARNRPELLPYNFHLKKNTKLR